jgi:TRAP-type C4-dicarboxylate transport system permease small subunit
MRVIESVFSAVAWALIWIATIALLSMTVIVVSSAFMRYVAGRPFSFTEELVALMYMAMVFLAIPISTVLHRQVSITVISERLMVSFAHPFRILAALIMIVFCAWFGLDCFLYVRESYVFNSKSEQVGLLLWPWMAIMPFVMWFVALISALHFVQAVHAWLIRSEVREYDQGGDAL